MNNEFEKVKQKLEKYNQTNLINLLERLKNKDELVRNIKGFKNIAPKLFKRG